MERLLRRGSAAVKKTFEVLLDGEVLNMEIDEQIVYDQQPKKKNAVWSLLLAGRYVVASNRESGFGRYDVMPDPRNVSEDDAVIIEFKVQDNSEEKELSETANAALRQIEEKKYATMLIEKGVTKEKIRIYGFAFCGKRVLIERG